jgi:predicted helicase
VLIHRISKNKSLFPTSTHENIAISITGLGVVTDFTCIATKYVPASKLTENGQCFPLYIYEERNDITNKFELENHAKSEGFKKVDGITDQSLKRFREVYSDHSITKRNVFSYIYAILHSPDYRSRFGLDLKKVLPKIPFAKDFWIFSKAGDRLIDLHVNFETVKPYSLKEEITDSDIKSFRVTSMRFGKKGNETDRSTIVYNSFITLSEIPTGCYEYKINGKSALEWVMEKYSISIDKDSGIKNDPNDWSSDPRFIIDHVKRVVSVSLETNQIVTDLPKLEIVDEAKGS